MKKLILTIVAILLIAVFVLLKDKAVQGKSLIILVENRLADPLKEYIEQYKKDLEKEGYSVIKKNLNVSTSPVTIRKLLQNEYENAENLKGAVFIGNISAPKFNELKHQGDIYWFDYLSDFFYMDLDGTWKDADNNGVYDTHSETGLGLINNIIENVNPGYFKNPEIWVSRIRADNLSSLDNELDLLKKYFIKNHKYRNGELKFPAKRAFIVSSSIDVIKSGWGARPDIIYSSVDVIQFSEGQADSLKKFLSDSEGYELGVVSTFSGASVHHFDFFINGLDTLWKEGEESKKLKVNFSKQDSGSGKVSWKDINEIQPNVLFYHLLTSETGRHDQKNYLSGSYIFSGMGLLAIAGTQHSGAVGSLNFYKDIKSGKSFGEAWKNDLIWKIENSGDLLNIYTYNQDTLKWKTGASLQKAVLIGDGTLKLPRFYNNN